MKFDIFTFDVLNSTNDTAKNYPVGSVILAKEQLAGRGRMGRHWQSDRGNLFLSVVVPDFKDKTPLLSFLAAVSVAKALDEFHPTLKWPNDVLINNKKVCGILLEQADNGIIIGIGLNIIPPARTHNFLYPVSSLNGAISVPKATECILKNLNLLIDQAKIDNFYTVLETWKNYACGLGKKMTVRLPNETLEGRFQSLDSNGRLCLTLSDGSIRKISAGDVFFKDNDYE